MSMAAEARQGRLAGKVALVTGAARGIGRAIARAFLAEGATVWLTDLDDAALAAPDDHPAARRLRLDVREEGDWAAAIAAVRARDGWLDVLVNNAGITGLEAGAAHDPETATLADWRAVLATDLDGVFLGCRAALGAMRGTGGAIINIASRSGMVGIAGAAAYAAAKAAVRNHTRSVALYAAERRLGIRCNTISPAAVLTPMWEPLLGDGPDREARMAACVADTPLRRFGTAEEVAAVAVLLASDECPYMTGAEVTIDGGLLAGAATVSDPDAAPG
jgi:NAD(P)-dependent dehydrogenase (short-subunit alcohol dehydrogenase family)